MSDAIVMRTYQGVRDAMKAEERDYRGIEGSGFAVSRGGKVYLEGDFPEIDAFPWLTVLNEKGLYRAHVPAAVAWAWLTPEERAEIRAELPADVKAADDAVKALVARYNVWAYAIAHVAATPEEDLVILDEKPLQTWREHDTRRLENVQVTDYKTFLYEHSRPPSRGGNTSAIHTHSFRVGDRKFGFFARGSKKFIFAKDLASFDYYETDEGYLNVLRWTIICRDAKGKRVIRGDRRLKEKLRSAPTRLPGPRRDWK